ncbi:MAG: HupE/UreJ family protein [Phototrophicaceae bacterium]
MDSVLFFNLAHTLASDAGIIAGFLHPILGYDHLLAMLAVGLLSAQIGGRAIWTVPTAFVVMMVIGGMIGFFGGGLPFIEEGIAGSVILLGGVLLFQQRERLLPEMIALIIVGVFAIFHGYAHGAEVPVEKTAIFFLAYVFGFVVATAGLHIIGALIGYIAMRSDRGSLILRGSGLLIAAIGVYFFLSI